MIHCSESLLLQDLAIIFCFHSVEQDLVEIQRFEDVQFQCEHLFLAQIFGFFSQARILQEAAVIHLVLREVTVAGHGLKSRSASECRFVNILFQLLLMLLFSLGEKIGLTGSTLCQRWIQKYLDITRFCLDIAVLALCHSSLFGRHLLLPLKILLHLPQYLHVAFLLMKSVADDFCMQ